MNIVPILQNIFSLTNSKNHTTINFLGLRIKYKHRNIPEQSHPISTYASGYEIHGQNNKIIIIEENGSERQLLPNEKIDGLNIRINADNSLVRIQKPTKFRDCTLLIENDNCTYDIKSTIYEIGGTIFHLSAPCCKIQIGHNLSTGCGTQINGFSSENVTVSIGNDCMISFGVIIRPDDGHTIFSPESKQILNYGKDIKIGNHVWLGEQVIILKGAVIPDNTIVGAKSLVNKQFQPGGASIAGIPAKIIKTNINWSRLPQYIFKQTN